MDALDTLMIDGVAWLLIENSRVLLEMCPKKAAKMGLPAGTWFVPGGKLEAGETPDDAVRREIAEEWPGVTVGWYTPLPLVQASRDGAALFLMRPFVVTLAPDSDDPPACASNGVPLRWVPLDEAKCSPVPQVRMMVAAACGELLP